MRGHNTEWRGGTSRLRAAVGLLLFAAAVSLLAFLLCLAFLLSQPPGHNLPSELQIILGEGVLLLAVLVGTAVMALIERRSIWSYGLGGPHSLQRFLWGAFWGLALMSLLIGWLIVTWHLAIETPLLHNPDVVRYGLVYGAGFVIAALTEETLFRGYLQTTLARIVGFWPAAILLSFAFGFVHLSNTGESAFGIVTIVLFGVVLSLCLRLSGSLWWGIGFHAAWDWAQSYLYGTPVSGLLLEEPLLESRAMGDPLWSGGTAGPEASVLVIPILCAAVAVIALTFRRPAAAIKSIGSPRLVNGSGTAPDTSGS